MNPVLRPGRTACSNDRNDKTVCHRRCSACIGQPSVDVSSGSRSTDDRAASAGDRQARRHHPGSDEACRSAGRKRMPRRTARRRSRRRSTATAQAAPPATPAPPFTPLAPAEAPVLIGSPQAASAPADDTDEAYVARALENTLVDQGSLLLSPFQMQLVPDFSYQYQSTVSTRLRVAIGHSRCEREIVVDPESHRDLLEWGLGLKSACPGKRSSTSACRWASTSVRRRSAAHERQQHSWRHR